METDTSRIHEDVDLGDVVKITLRDDAKAYTQRSKGEPILTFYLCDARMEAKPSSESYSGHVCVLSEDYIELSQGWDEETRKALGHKTGFNRAAIFGYETTNFD